jgi:hypothetical protein
MPTEKTQHETVSGDQNAGNCAADRRLDLHLSDTQFDQKRREMAQGNYDGRFERQACVHDAGEFGTYDNTTGKCWVCGESSSARDVRDIESSPYCDPCETGRDDREEIALRRARTLAKLVRALNDAGWRSARAFYCVDGKFNCARVRARRLQIGMCQRGWKTLVGCTVFEDFRGDKIGQYDPELI